MTTYQPHTQVGRYVVVYSRYTDRTYVFDENLPADARFTPILTLRGDIDLTVDRIETTILLK